MLLVSSAEKQHVKFRYFYYFCDFYPLNGICDPMFHCIFRSLGECYHPPKLVESFQIYPANDCYMHTCFILFDHGKTCICQNLDFLSRITTDRHIKISLKETITKKKF